MRPVSLLAVLGLFACQSGSMEPLGGLSDSGEVDLGGGESGDGGSGGGSGGGGTGEDTDDPGLSLADAMTEDGLMAHLEALDDIGLENDDTRSAGADGYSASTAYVVGQLESWGYTVEVEDFAFDGYMENAPAELVVDGEDLGEEGTDFRTFAYSEGGTGTGELVAVDLMLPPSSEANSSTSGCESSDFADFPEGGIALIQRGSCTFSEKVNAARSAGASGVVIFNEGQSDRSGLIGGYLDGGSGGLPVLDATFDMGEALSELAGSTVSISTDATYGEIPSVNIIAETAGGDSDQVLMVGSHLDSVTAGPGINDNGSGSATVLEIARAAAELGYEPAYRVRFAFWGAEEIGLLGSEAYVDSLSKDEADRIIGYLNYDMVGSPNGARFVYDGDGSDSSAGAGPSGSDDIEAVYEEWFEAQGEDILPTPFDGRSDYGPFIWSGIPAGGLFSGAEQSKSSGEADVFGGVAGDSYDACYHRGCDTVENIDTTLLVELAKAAAHATQVLSTEPILGTAGAVPGASPRRDVPEELVQSFTHKGCGEHAIR